MIRRLDHVHVVARDIEASIAFYTDVLGFRLLRHVRFGPNAERQLAYVGLGDVMIELVQPAHEGDFQGTEGRPIGLTVDDLDDAIARFEAHGVEIVQPPGPGFSFGGRQAVVRDPSGLLLEVRQWDPADYPMSPDWQPARDDVTKLA